ncbi:MAG: hypothetical protein J6X50_01340 [Bacilli bacterium]|nr:hypothetical protein [Bacilli bacterium]
MVLYLGIIAFIALFGIVYEQFSHNVHTFYMWFAWIWPLIFGFIPYLLLYVLKAKRVPGLLTESVYNFGVAMLTVRSVFKGVIIIYNTTNDAMVLFYTILAVVALLLGAALYVIGLLINKRVEPH